MVSVCMLVAVLFPTVTASMHKSRTESKEAHTLSRYLWDKVNLGKRWEVYIQVMAYDLLHSSFYRQGSSNYWTSETLLDVVTHLTTVATNNHPCRKSMQVIRGRQFHGNFFVHNATSSNHFGSVAYRICGVFNFTYYPSHYIDESNVVLSELSDLVPVLSPVGILRFKHNIINLKAGEGFRINCTLSEFTAPRSHTCADGFVKVVLFYPEKYTFYVMCPNWGKQNFVASHITVMVFMHYYQKSLLMQMGDQPFTNLSFHYQILDFVNVSLKTLDLFPIRQRVKNRMEYMLRMHYFYNDTFLTRPNSSMYVGKFPNALIYSVALHTDDLLTPVISIANVTCNIPGEIIFYDGPAQTFWQPVLPLLKHWGCSNISDGTTGGSDQDEVRGSVGELNIILFVPRVKKHESVFLTIAWHAERILPGILQFRKIFVDFGTVKTIYFKSTRSTSVEVVHIQAPNDTFVHLGVPEISHVLHSQMHSSRFFEHCLDGLEIKDPKMIHVSGLVCSNSTAQNLLKHYQTAGLTVGQEVILKKKQYAWIASISAVITASATTCAGYINVLPKISNMFSRTKTPEAVVSFDAARKYFENGSFAGYENLLIIFKRALKACCKLQLVPFNNLESYELHLHDLFKQTYSYLKYTITSEDLTSPARFITDFSSIGYTLQFGNTSSSYGLRLYSLNNRFQKHPLPYTGVWDTEAYSAEIALHSNSLTYATGFKVQVEDGKTLPVCTREDGTNGTYFFFYDINLSGPCAYAELNSQMVRSVVIHKTYESMRCCYVDGYMATDFSIDGIMLLYLFVAESYEPWIGSWWDFSENNTVIKFQVLCKNSCLSVGIEVRLDRVPLRTVRIAYHTNVIEQTYAPGITFPHLRFPFDVATPQSGLVTWNQVCHGHKCYITPRRHMPVTWNEAQKICKEHQGHLVSINSDLEWALLTRLPQQEGEEFIELYNIRGFIIFYIGLVTDVSNY